MTTRTFAALALFTVATNLGAAPSVYPTGVTRYDTAAAYNSYVIPSGQDKNTHLIDMNGNEVHRWNAEGFPPVLLDPALTGGKRGYVLAQLASTTGTSNEGNGLRNQAIGELDWNSKVIWQWGAAGGAQDVYAAPVEGTPSPQVLDDVIYEVTPGGDIVWKWVASDHLNEFGFKPESLKLVKNGYSPRGKAAPFDYLHINNMSVLGPNRWFDAGDQRFNPENILIDSREANFIVILDKQTGKVVWSLGPDYPAQVRGPRVLPRPVDQIVGQHDAHLIEPGSPGAGHILVFDSQRRRAAALRKSGHAAGARQVPRSHELSANTPPRC